MTKEEIFNYFYSNSANLGAKTITLVMLSGLIISAIIYFTYMLSYKGVAYNKKFNESLVVILLISIVIMLMISSNIVISLGMVGALSIVRFRTAIKDPRDTVYIFWAIAEGLSVGSLNFKLALITSLIIALVIILLNYLPKNVNKYLLIIRGNGNSMIDVSELLSVIKQYSIDSKIRTANKNDSSQEMIIELKVKNDLNLDLIEKLLKIKGITAVNFISESGENVG